MDRRVILIITASLRAHAFGQFAFTEQERQIYVSGQAASIMGSFFEEDERNAPSFDPFEEELAMSVGNLTGTYVTSAARQDSMLTLSTITSSGYIRAGAHRGSGWGSGNSQFRFVTRFTIDVPTPVRLEFSLAFEQTAGASTGLSSVASTSLERIGLTGPITIVSGSGEFGGSNPVTGAHTLNLAPGSYVLSLDASAMSVTVGPLSLYCEAQANLALSLTAGACYPDCDDSGALTVADFSCFQSKFVAGEPYADCDSSGAHTVADFSCFQSAFAAGCP